MSAGGALYQDDPLGSGTPQMVAQAPETWHQPLTVTRPGANGQPETTVLQAGSRGGVRELGPGSVGTAGRGGAAGQGTALQRNAEYIRSIHPEMTPAQALEAAQRHQGQSEEVLRGRASAAAARLRGPDGQAYPPEVQTRIANAYLGWFRGGSQEDLEAGIRGAMPQPAQQQPGLFRRAVDGVRGLFGDETATPPAQAGTPAGAPDPLAGGGAPARSNPPGAAEAAPAAGAAPRRDTSRGSTPQAEAARVAARTQAEAIRSRFQRGEISREEATRQLQALGAQ